MRVRRPERLRHERTRLVLALGLLLLVLLALGAVTAAVLSGLVRGTG